MNIEIFWDEIIKLYYVYFNNKKMYFKRELDTPKQVLEYYKFLMMEQDENSPHRYLDGNMFDVNAGDVVIDAGVAEGNFALSIIEKVKKIYLIEVDDGWLEALKYTFLPFADKIVIIPKYLSDNCENNCITIDEIVREKEEIDFIKMDIEGAEHMALNGAKKTIKNSRNIKIVACTYHNETIAKKLLHYFKTNNMETIFSKGYMFFIHAENGDPLLSQTIQLRKGLIKAKH